jgi:restriction endonuclease S subunit
MREGWIKTNIGSAFHIQQGKTLAISKLMGGKYPVYGANGIVGYFDEFNFDFPVTGLGCRGSCGTIYYIDSKAFLANNVMAIWEKDASKIDSRYIPLALGNVDLIASGAISGQVQPQITKQGLEPVAITIPPLPEQKRIVDLISSVDSYIEALQQQLESAKKSRNALTESQILEVSNSSLCSLKNLSTKIGSGATPRGGEEVYIKSGVNLIRSQNVHDSNFVMRGLVAIEDSAAKALENVTVEEDDVLINITGASVTRCCVVDSTILPARVNQHVAIIRSDRAKILPKYLVLILTSNEVKGFLNDIAGTGSTRQALTKTHLEDLEIPVPNISKQAEIIENSDAFDLTISKLQIALDGAKILRSGLLNDLLSGEHEIPANYDQVIGAE